MKQKFIRTSYIQTIIKWLQNDRLVLLTGARQVGKTTLMQQVEKDLGIKSIFVNMEDWFGQQRNSKKDFVDWLMLEHWFDVYQPWLLMLDEVQYLKMPDALLKSLYDDSKIQCFILATGSRFWGQQRVGSSLVWRGKIIRVHSYSFLEFLQAKGLHISAEKLQTISYDLIQSYLNEYLQYGWYPAVVNALTHQEKQETLEAILWRMIEKDFLAYLTRDELIDFRKVFQFLARSLGSLRKTNKIAQEIWLSNYKVNKYLQFIEDLFLIQKIHPYFTDRSKEYKSQVKYFFHDIGVFRYFVGDLLSESQQWALVENFVYCHLSCKKQYKNLYFWRNKAGSEIDFIAEDYNKNIEVIEVKSGDKTHIPRVFHSFFEVYKNSIKEWLCTTKTLQKQAKISDKIVNFVPFWRL